MTSRYSHSAIRWVPVVNVDTEPAPPYALLATSGVDNQGRVQVQRPGQNSQQGLLINGPGLIPAGGGGQAHQAFPAVVAYDDGGDAADNTPQAGQVWGSVASGGTANAWKLQKGQGGFLMLGGGAYGLTNCTALRIACP